MNHDQQKILQQNRCAHKYIKKRTRNNSQIPAVIQYELIFKAVFDRLVQHSLS